MPSKKTSSSTKKIPQFSIGDLINQAWEIFKEQWLVFYGLMIGAWIVLAVLGMVMELLPEQPFFVLTGVIINIGLQFLVSAILIKGMLDITDRRKLDFTSILQNPSILVNLLIGSFLLSFIVIGGFILLIIPGIIWSIKYRFTPYLIVEKGMGPLEALRESGRLTQGHKWNIFVLGLVLFLVNLLGVLALVIGLVVSIPVTAIAQVALYRHFVPRK